MSILSNAFHAFLNSAKSEFHTIVGDVETVANGVGSDVISSLENVLKQLPAVLSQAAQAGVTAALAASVGGAPAAIIAAAEAAAVTTLTTIGKPILSQDIVALKAAVLAHFVSQTATTPATPAS